MCKTFSERMYLVQGFGPDNCVSFPTVKFFFMTIALGCSQLSTLSVLKQPEHEANHLPPSVVQSLLD